MYIISFQVKLENLCEGLHNIIHGILAGKDHHGRFLE